MRSEKEMLDLILGIAKDDERIRAVYMNGSRTNPNVPKDIFQDYDIVYVVTETESFIEDRQWINIFGEFIMVQEPDRLDKAIGMKVDFSQSYAYLMLFVDGNRIDLQIETKEYMMKNYLKDKLTVPLLDKDHCLPDIPLPTERGYYIKRPTEGHFISCTNDFWWCLQNVAKGIWRDQLPYSKHMFECIVRTNLEYMISWWIGIAYDFQVSLGAMNKYFKKYLPKEYWKMYEKTYADGNYDHMWEAIFVACQLFRILGRDVATAFDFSYPEEDDLKMTRYLRCVKDLPVDAKEIIT